MCTRLVFKVDRASSVWDGKPVRRVSRMGHLFLNAAGDAASASGKLSPTARNTSSAEGAPCLFIVAIGDLGRRVVAVAALRCARRWRYRRRRPARSVCTASDTTEFEPMMIACVAPRLVISARTESGM